MVVIVAAASGGGGGGGFRCLVKLIFYLKLHSPPCGVTTLMKFY